MGFNCDKDGVIRAAKAFSLAHVLVILASKLTCDSSCCKRNFFSSRAWRSSSMAILAFNLAAYPIGDLLAKGAKFLLLLIKVKLTLNNAISIMNLVGIIIMSLLQFQKRGVHMHKLFLYFLKIHKQVYNLIWLCGNNGSITCSWFLL